VSGEKLAMDIDVLCTARNKSTLHDGRLFKASLQSGNDARRSLEYARGQASSERSAGPNSDSLMRMGCFAVAGDDSMKADYSEGNFAVGISRLGTTERQAV
jgi:hypothetical protein